MSEIIYKKRDERLDFIRGLAMVGIVLIHVNSYFEYFFSFSDFFFGFFRMVCIIIFSQSEFIQLIFKEYSNGVL